MHGDVAGARLPGSGILIEEGLINPLPGSVPGRSSTDPARRGLSEVLAVSADVVGDLASAPQGQFAEEVVDM
jgi:hypothetical protein